MSVFIKINEKLAIVSDDNQWCLTKPVPVSRKDKKTGVKRSDVEWRAFKYYPTLAICVKKLGEYLLRTSNAQNIDELVKAAGDISMMLSQKFTASADVHIK